MKVFFALFAICVVVAVGAVDLIENDASDNQFCYGKVHAACAKSDQKGKSSVKPICNARFGAMTDDQSTAHILAQLQRYVNTHITRSYEYLMMATHYANFEKNRPGFEKLFRGLSDEKWSAACKLIEFITKRGGEMDFNQYTDIGTEEFSVGQYELYELQSVAKALDIEKKLTMDANRIHSEAIGKNRTQHDSDMSHFLEEEFTEKQSATIRKLSGYTTDLTSLLSSSDGSIALYLFDEYLIKQ